MSVWRGQPEFAKPEPCPCSAAERLCPLPSLPVEHTQPPGRDTLQLWLPCYPLQIFRAFLLDPEPPIHPAVDALWSLLFTTFLCRFVTRRPALEDNSVKQSCSCTGRPDGRTTPWSGSGRTGRNRRRCGRPPMGATTCSGASAASMLHLWRGVAPPPQRGVGHVAQAGGPVVIRLIS